MTNKLWSVKDLLLQQDFLVPTTGYQNDSSQGRLFTHRKPASNGMHILILHFIQKQFFKTGI